MPSWNPFSRKKSKALLALSTKGGRVNEKLRTDRYNFDDSSTESLSPDLIRRTCICCGTALQVPKHLTAFKCGLCDTHVDLPTSSASLSSSKRRLSMPAPTPMSIRRHTRSASSAPFPTLAGQGLSSTTNSRSKPAQITFVDSAKSHDSANHHGQHHRSSKSKGFVLILGTFERTIERAEISNDYSEVKQMIVETFRSVDTLNHTFAIQRHRQSYDSSNVDFMLVKRFYDLVLSLPHHVPGLENPLNTLFYAMLGLLKRPGKPLLTPYDISFLLVLLENPLYYKGSLFAKRHRKPADDKGTIHQELNRQISNDLSDFDGNWPTSNSHSAPLPESQQDLRLTQVKTSPASLQTTKSRIPSHHTTSSRPEHLDFSRSMALEVLERTVGILVFTSKTCKQYVIKWLSRYPVAQFEPKVDLLNAYIAHNLTKQYQNNSSRRKRHKRAESTPATSVSNHPIFGGGLFAFSSRGYDGVAKSREQTRDAVANSGASSSLTGPSLNHITHWLPTIPGVSSRPKLRRLSAGSIRSELYSGDWNITTFVKLLSILFSANTLANSKIPISHFYNTMVDYIDISADFDDWQRMGKPLSSDVHRSQHRANLSYNKNYPTTLPENLGTDLDYLKPSFSFCQYPFLLSMGSKTEILEYDARRQMELKAQEAFFGSLTNKVPQNPYLYIRVHRQSVLLESFEELERHSQDLKKGLRIEFIGEPGIDAGGLKKEWFMLVTRNLFDPAQQIFVEDEESKYCWFNDDPDQRLLYYRLTGEIIGLALYNSTILEINFPLVLFKKLLGASYSLDDFIQLHPTYGRSLRQLLTYDDDDFEDVFGLNFCVTKINPKTGRGYEVPLQLNGEKTPVTKANRMAYVKKVMSYYLDVSIEKQFLAFKQGFYKVAGGNALSLFRPEEVELLLRGCLEPIDIDALRSVTKYQHWGTKPGDGEHVVVKWFWRFFQNLEPLQQRKLLVFVTGSDRIPATGITTMTFRISKIGEDCEKFPISHTCFNQLCLFSYSSREKLETKLLRAINESEGFGMK